MGRKPKQLSKRCAYCGARFFKPACCGVPEWTTRRRFCSPACKKASQVGQPSSKKGKTYPHLHKPGIPCRICGRPTTCHDRARIGLISCNRPLCRMASRARKNVNIRDALKAAHQVGQFSNGRSTDCFRYNWKRAPLVSPEENLLWPHIESFGFQRQYRVVAEFLAVKKKVRTIRIPHSFQLDFAHPDRKFYVEVDGSSHNNEESRRKDAQRDRLLANVGWTGIRVSSQEVNENCHKVAKKIGQLLRR